jgi:hypothetical protein
MFGNISFSKFFADELLSGKTLNKAYTNAMEKLHNQGSVYATQIPVIHAGTEMKNIQVGGGFAAASMSLTSIDQVEIDDLVFTKDSQSSESVDLTDKKTISLKTTITAGSGINKVWAVLMTPDYTPPPVGDFVTPDLTKYTIDLAYNSTSKKYEATYTIPTDKTYSGEYDITVYVEDVDGLVYSSNNKIDGNGEKEVDKSLIDTNSYITYSKGWYMTALPKSTNMNNIDKIQNIQIIWNYKNGKWGAYSSNSTILDKIKKESAVLDIKSIDNNQGYWILANNSVTVGFKANETISDFNINNIPQGWSMISTNQIDDISAVFSDNSIKSIWNYKNGKWYLFTSSLDKTPAGLEELNILKKYDAIWINKK